MKFHKALLCAAGLLILLCTSSYAAEYKDVSIYSWYYKYVIGATNNSFLKGYSDSEFKPQNSITHVELYQILYNIEKEPEVKDSNTFNVENRWYKNSLLWALENKIAKLSDISNANVTKPLLRKEVIEIIYNFSAYKEYDLKVKDNDSYKEFEDCQNLSDDEKKIINWAVEKGIVNGSLVNNKKVLNLNSSITRAEICTILDRFNVTFLGGKSCLEDDESEIGILQELFLQVQNNKEEIDKLMKNSSKSRGGSSTTIVSDAEIKSKLGLDKQGSDKYNFAILDYTDSLGLKQTEFWIFSNAYYDYDAKRFMRIDPNNTSFGIQILASGTYAGEGALGYVDNQSIGFWRSPSKNRLISEGYLTASSGNEIGYDFQGNWNEYGVYAGWNNCFMLDSFGGMTIGGSGFEIDGNGLYPFVRLSNSKYVDPSDPTKHFTLTGIIQNAYHSLTGCDSVTQPCLFFGFKSEEDPNYVNLTQLDKSKFVIMKLPVLPDTTMDYIDNTKWETILEVSDTDIKFNGASLLGGAQSSMVKVTSDNVSFTQPTIYHEINYPFGFNKNNSLLQGGRILQNDGTVKGVSISSINYTDYAVGMNITSDVTLADKIEFIFYKIQ